MSKIATKHKSPDYIMLSLILILVIWGLITVGTISFHLSLQVYKTPWYYFFHQIIMVGIGISFAIITFNLSLATLKKWGFYLFFLNLIVILFVFLPKIGVRIGGARRWISLTYFLFQPSEFLKITFILYLASWLSKKLNFSKQKKFFLLFLPFLVIIGVLIIILILQPDMSTLAIICVIGAIMYFLTFTPWWHSLILFILGIGGGLALIKVAPYRLTRVLVFLNPQIDPLGIGYQLRQAFIALGSGGWFGIEKGFAFGLSRQKFGFLPHSLSDSIFAIIGEELGFVGCSFLICIFLLFIWRGLKIAYCATTEFAQLLAVGIVVWIGFQAFFNIGGIIGILPLGGVPLPFFSYGGSHLIAELIGIGILLNISKNN